MTDLQDLTKQFDALVHAGDEQAARKFLIAHFQEFPKDMQEKITFAFFSEAVVDQADILEATAGVQKEGIDALKTFMSAKAELENVQRIDELKGQLGATPN